MDAKTFDSKSLLDSLFENGILFESGIDGLYGRSGAFEEVIERFERLVTRLGAPDKATRIHFPPGMSRATLEKSGYMKSFPQLAGCVHSFMGGEREHAQLLGMIADGGDWTELQKATDVALTPAACYPLYPTIAARGPVPAQGLLFELSSYCFRHEPSKDPARMQLFRMREFVKIGTAEQVRSFRESWLKRGKAMIESLDLPCEVDLANDPFFGRGGKMMANNQRDQGLKFELLIPVTSIEKPTACLSFNYHQDHFGRTWGLKFADGEFCHSACVGFGLERVALALFRHHGPDADAWPAAVRDVLWSV
ncbi:MAG: amino acid--[acyl-carrier-protein] ligase [Mesorhizobium sp.]|uniref:amino acid--[acyl-carrier-protein] ligase n=1 Tax=Mesorhizobium sp. TaxID=1871066 RepID=UPI000FE509ED|nr:amino acid--[acyl-carrier-protein] ligase [Mesorhizobium sp.]RWM05271.1 MAG: amino acid--[acyl-carrier-protein] ligase [Mesorhizobium sp.]TIO53934.1 MAG: amino acid--[acyl-carrier-protein] ligase [Mesorhizobium sp.]TIO61561.1 MAG: amino acid--[acyl-carrier-protein] ligase [Mesorhizobium sp.]TJV65946.1 MAG: amino acid--[acyl-carrier-protein] ligase [Mesorhizobium sp.]